MEENEKKDKKERKKKRAILRSALRSVWVRKRVSEARRLVYNRLEIKKKPSRLKLMRKKKRMKNEGKKSITRLIENNNNKYQKGQRQEERRYDQHQNQLLRNASLRGCDQSSNL